MKLNDQICKNYSVGDDMYPKNDEEYREVIISTVGNDGKSFSCDDGWSFSIPDDYDIIPKVNMGVRFYGKGIGHSVRGLFLNGKQVYYKTQEENDIYQKNLLYGKDAQEWVDRWDRGDGVWSIEMGGIGPGYEQAIQITAVEIVKHMLKSKYDSKGWEDNTTWEKWKKDNY